MNPIHISLSSPFSTISLWTVKECSPIISHTETLWTRCNLTKHKEGGQFYSNSIDLQSVLKHKKSSLPPWHNANAVSIRFASPIQWNHSFFVIFWSAWMNPNSIAMTWVWATTTVEISVKSNFEVYFTVNCLACHRHSSHETSSNIQCFFLFQVLSELRSNWIQPVRPSVNPCLSIYDFSLSLSLSLALKECMYVCMHGCIQVYTYTIVYPN